ncbi:MAG: HAD-IA family hydrolase [Lachnospiraceae bacterium]|nr:HAD-IA family hydrolase [Lachnospiraceae bacterium]MBP3609225.1 HAD-IA family hydrolase [Lachnospiraceae bacterium]
MNAVVFDMDGLMFDTERVFVQAWDYAGEKMGIGKAGFMTIKTLGMNVERSRQVWIEEFGDRYHEEELRSYSREFRDNYYANNKVPVKKGLYVLLDYLKEHGYKLAVASSSPRWEVEHHLKDAGVFDYFQAVVCGDMVSKSKPEPEIYLRACELLGEQPEDCVALEDSRNGLLSAHRAGMRVIMVPDLWEADEEVKQFLWNMCADLEEVKDFLLEHPDKK